jgi:hypothetical protein
MTVWQMEGFGMITEMRHWAEAISKAYDMTAWGHTQRAAEILKQTRKRICAAIAEAEKQEPVAWAVFEGWNAHDLYLPQEYDEALKMAGYKGDHAEVKPLYTTPPAAQRQWVGLTDEDCKGMNVDDMVVAMWADRVLKEKNT